MHVPAIYRGDEANAAEIVRGRPLAVLLTNGDPVPHATHVPVVAPPGADPRTLAGATFWGHLNRTNPHWAALAAGTRARLVFTGPHSYVTPAVYPAGPAAPTWNYVSVHLTGTLTPLPSGRETLAVVTRTAEVFEQKFGAGWPSSPSHGYFEQLLPGVGAFRFAVYSFDAMFKLSQEKPPAVRHDIAHWLAGTPTGNARDLADLMLAMVGPDAGDVVAMAGPNGAS
jgi:transcriptional regulator